MGSGGLLRAVEAAAILNSLAIGLSERYARTGKLQDLDVAIALSAAELNLTPQAHPNRAMILSILGYQFGRRYTRTGNMRDLMAAIA